MFVVIAILILCCTGMRACICDDFSFIILLVRSDLLLLFSFSPFLGTKIE